MEDGRPAVGSGKGDGDKEGANAAEDGVEEGGERSVGVGTLELLDTGGLRIEAQQYLGQGRLQSECGSIGSTAYALWK